MNEGYVLALVAAGGAATYLVRVSFLFMLGRRASSPVAGRILRHIPAATLAALTVPAVLSPGGYIDVSTANLLLPAALVAFVVGLKTKSVLWVLASGMGSLWLLELLAS